MAQTHIGAMKIAAKLAGIPLDEYLSRIALGRKRCRVCAEWKQGQEFNEDKSRHDGRAALCRDCQGALNRRRYVPVKIKKPHGPPPKPARDGDKRQARARINVLVRTGRLPKPNDVRCINCGHIGSDRRHEYHHAKGYGAQYHLAVEVLCTVCHCREDSAWARKSRNKKGQFCGTKY